MRIDRLKVQNFKGFADREFVFSRQMNVIIGDNGSGKTALLDALAVAAGALFIDFRSVPAHQVQRTINHDEVHVERRVTASLPVNEPLFPVSVTAHGWIALATDEIEYEWSRRLDRQGGRTSNSGVEVLRAASKVLQKKVSARDPVILPVISYYGTGRVWKQLRESRAQAVGRNYGRMLGYVNALNPASDIKALNRWFRTAEWTESAKGRKVGGLDAIKAALLKCLPGFDDIRFDHEYGELAGVIAPTPGQKSATWRPFHELSDGYRTMLGMVADIAYRAIVLNPDLGDAAAEQTPGIVLIDEIDLHLHPTWQRRVLNDLRRAFPRVQFFVTTHSPFIVQSARAGEVVNLDDRPRAEHANRSVEDISEYVMGVEQPQRSKAFQEKEEAAQKFIEKARELPGLSGKQRKKRETELDRLLEQFSDDPAYVALLRMERLASEGGS